MGVTTARGSRGIRRRGPYDPSRRHQGDARRRARMAPTRVAGVSHTPRRTPPDPPDAWQGRAYSRVMDTGDCALNPLKTIRGVIWQGTIRCQANGWPGRHRPFLMVAANAANPEGGDLRTQQLMGLLRYSC